MEEKNKTGKIVFFVVIGIAVLAGLFQMATGKNQPAQSTTTQTKKQNSFVELFKGSNSKEEKWIHSDGEEYIAKLYITGVIQDKNETYNQKWLLKKIQELKEDQDNKAIVLFIDSPGGGVYQADEAYLALSDYASSGKPIYAYMGPLAASGGYYLACSAKHIMANRNTLTGSIGVIAGQFTDATALLEKVGIKSETIHSGRNKNMGSFNESVTEEQRQIMQSIADECYEQFIQIVSKSRGISISKVQELADGRIYTAKQAKDNSLIDTVGSFDELLSLVGQKEFNGETYPVEEVEYKKDETLYSLLMGMTTAIKGMSSFLPEDIKKQAEASVKSDTPYPAFIYEGTFRY